MASVPQNQSSCTCAERSRAASPQLPVSAAAAPRVAVAPGTPPRRPVPRGGTGLVLERPGRRRRSGTQASAPGRPGLHELRAGRQRDAGSTAVLTTGPKKGEAVTWRRLPPRRWPRAPSLCFLDASIGLVLGSAARPNPQVVAANGGVLGTRTAPGRRGERARGAREGAPQAAGGDRPDRRPLAFSARRDRGLPTAVRSARRPRRWPAGRCRKTARSRGRRRERVAAGRLGEPAPGTVGRPRVARPRALPGHLLGVLHGLSPSPSPGPHGM